MATRRRVAEYFDAAIESGENQQEKKGQSNTVANSAAFARVPDLLMLRRGPMFRAWHPLNAR